MNYRHRRVFRASAVHFDGQPSNLEPKPPKPGRARAREGDGDGGELGFPAVVFSTWRQVAGRLRREGREDATKPARAVPCNKRPCTLHPNPGVYQVYNHQPRTRVQVGFGEWWKKYTRQTPTKIQERFFFMAPCQYSESAPAKYL